MTQSKTMQLRRGVTVLEVLFATGIAISGMLGIASLLLMAGRQASQSNRSLETQTLADDWYNEFLTRGMNHPSNWIWYRDFQVPGGGLETNAQLKQFQKLQYTGSPLARLTHSTGSRGNQLLRPLGKLSVCIDPSFYSDRAIRATMSAFNEGSSSLWYRPAVFPYYQDGFNPLTDSDYLTTSTSGLAWADQPRMLRASLGTTSSIMSEKQVESMFSSTNELTMLLSEDDKTLAPQRGYQFMPVPGSNPVSPMIAKGANSAKYSWMATLSPLEQADSSVESFYTLSLVVMHQRDKLFALPPGAFNERTSATPSPEEKPQGERLTWVVPLSGDFTGGNGGRVRLIASSGTKDTLGVGDWIMLSKHVSGVLDPSMSVNGSPRAEAYSVYRWYRIIAADADPTVNQLSTLVAGTPWNGQDPYGNTLTEDVWARDVVLDGPDWAFSITAPVTNLATGSTAPMLSPTSGTLVSGVVAVHERVVEIPDSFDF